MEKRSDNNKFLFQKTSTNLNKRINFNLTSVKYNIGIIIEINKII